MGYDNPAMEMGQSTTKLPSSPPPYNMIDNRDPNRGAAFVVPTSEKPYGDKDYDPYDHRDVEHPTTYSETLIHMLKASLGTGILAMPNAFYNAGYAVGLAGTLLIGLVCTYTIHILIQSEYELCRRERKPSLTYPATARAAVAHGPKPLRRFVNFVPHICNAFLLLYQLGSCCIYVVFVATNIKDVCDQYFSIIDVRWYMLIFLLPLILINFVRNLKYLAPLSTLANIVTIISFILIFYYLFKDLPNIADRVAVAPFKRMPLFFGTVLFAMEAIGVVMPLENEMKQPKKFGSKFGVLNCAMLPITLLYTLVGFVGYLQYGDTVKGSITLDLPPTEIPAQGVRVLLAFSIYITHAIACYVAIDIVLREYVNPRVTKNKLFIEYLVRAGLVFITFIFAVAIPNLELFISLIGALCLSTMGLSFPAFIQLFTYWYQVHGTQFALFALKNSIIIIIAILGFVIGTYTSIQGIIDEFFLHHNVTP